MDSWKALRFRLAAAREDAFVAACWAAGALGFESHPQVDGFVEVVVWSPDPVPGPLTRVPVESWGASRMGEKRVLEEDWLAEHRRWAEPFDVGRGFRVDPGDPGDPRAFGTEEQNATRRLLRIPARTAFGTGSHESTRLAIELIEDLEIRGRSILDVGTGSGILTFVALALGARSAVGFDLDPVALPIARDNARRNGFSPALFAGRIGALVISRPFDVVIVNALPHEVVDEMPSIVGALREGGSLVISGVPLDKEARVRAEALELGCRPRERRQAGEWVALEAVRESSA